MVHQKKKEQEDSLSLQATPNFRNFLAERLADLFAPDFVAQLVEHEVLHPLAAFWSCSKSSLSRTE